MKHPTQLWLEYKTLAYGKEPLPSVQEHHLRNAFHAGIEATFKAIADGNKDLDDEELAELIKWFRRHNSEVARSMNPTGLQ